MILVVEVEIAEEACNSYHSFHLGQVPPGTNARAAAEGHHLLRHGLDGLAAVSEPATPVPLTPTALLPGAQPAGRDDEGVLSRLDSLARHLDGLRIVLEKDEARGTVESQRLPEAGAQEWRSIEHSRETRLVSCQSALQQERFSARIRLKLRIRGEEVEHPGDGRGGRVRPRDVERDGVPHEALGGEASLVVPVVGCHHLVDNGVA
mmetsp:Transcript_10835/g.32158  ORF Transcript_10835/g.32158 Transcript_10835/m.32158 type:complete len:206 (-) Transcript_10835:257-874(-)